MQSETDEPESGGATLDRLGRGEAARVVEVTGDDAVARRLDDLGLRRGIEIRMIRRAPLGDPTVYELCGYQLCLRGREAGRVRVVRLEGAEASNTRAGSERAR
jgi:ferrous iron transport protein A